MPFVIDQKPTYKWKVVVKINKDGEVSQEIFTAHFKNISQSRFKEMIKMVEDKQIDDIDVATILTINQIKEKLKDTKFKVIDTGIKHGTVTIVSENRKVELTTLRKDIKTDGRHAEVEYTDSWQQDSERRDFTINAIYMDINGKLYDPQMGTVDLKNKNIKFIGDPQKRIEEDYLRIVRFIRFKVMYDIVVEPTTSDAIKQNLDGIQNFDRITQNFKSKKLFNN